MSMLKSVELWPWGRLFGCVGIEDCWIGLFDGEVVKLCPCWKLLNCVHVEGCYIVSVLLVVELCPS